MARTEPNNRLGNAHLLVPLLLAGILVALVVHIGVLMSRGDGRGSGQAAAANNSTGQAVSDGQTLRRTELPEPPAPPKPVGDPDRIRETVRAGRTYSATLKAGLDARVEDKAWGLKEVVSLAYAAEMQVDRTIEVNDGHCIVELRHFVVARNAKLLCNVDDFTIDLGLPGVLLLGALEMYQPGTTTAAAAAQPIAEAILGKAAQTVARTRATRAVAHVDSLSGKRVRITYVDGVGVESVMPIGCSLSAEEADFVLNTAVLSDCYILPDLKVKPAQSWSVDGAQLVGLLDPSLRGRTSGLLVLVREGDSQEGGTPHATLAIREGTLTVDRSDARNQRIGTFTPQGRLGYALTEGFVDRALLDGLFTLEEVSTDHILFETSFRARPTLKIDYTCTIR